MTPATAPTGIVIDLPAARGKFLLHLLVSVASVLPWLLPGVWLVGGYVLLSRFAPALALEAKVIALAVPCAALCLVVTLCYSDFLPRTITRAWLAAVVRRRADAVVDPDDPDAVFVRLLPREAWTWPARWDLRCGFLVADPDCGFVLFEGDDRRFVLPAGSLRSIGLEDFRASDWAYWTGRSSLVVLEASVGGLNTPWVAAVGPWPRDGWGTGKRDLRPPAADLRDRIAAVAATDPGDADEPDR